MKDGVLYFRRSGINHPGCIKRKSSGTVKSYVIRRKEKYLRATSSAVIDTGYTWTSNNVKIEIKFNNLNTNSATLFGVDDSTNGSTSTSGRYSLNAHTSLYNGLRFEWYIGKKANLGQSSSYPVDSKHILIIETNQNDSKVYCSIDGNEQSFTNSTAVIVNKTITNSIFGCHGNGQYNKFAPCDVYYCRMWDNGKLVRDLRPVKSGQSLNGVTFTSDGFYDHVEKTFHGNSNNDGSITYVEE